jgi:hypothetical protein
MNADATAKGRPKHPEGRLPYDDEPTVMGMDERATWMQLFATAATTGVYLGVVVPRALSEPIADISWVVPMLWAIGISMVAVILGSIAAGIGGAMVLTMRGRDVDSELKSDRRDKEIELYARRRTYWMLVLTVVGALVLAMLDAETFWIGNFVFLAATLESITQTVVKLRAYRRGFTS